MKKIIFTILLTFTTINFAQIYEEQREYNELKLDEIEQPHFVTPKVHSPNGMRDFYRIEKLDSAVNNYAYTNDIYIYEDSLLTKIIHRFSDSKATFKSDDVYRGLAINIDEYDYDNQGKLISVNRYCFPDSMGVYIRKYLYTSESYHYQDEKLIRRKVIGYNFTNSNVFYDYSYNNDTVYVIRSYTNLFNKDTTISSKKKMIYSNGLIISEEYYDYEQSKQAYKINYIIENTYNEFRQLTLKKCQRINDITGLLEYRYTVIYFYDDNNYLIKYLVNYADGSSNSKSYEYGNKGFVSFFLPKDKMQHDEIENFTLKSYSYKNNNVKYSYSIDDGNSWTNIVENINPDSAYKWQTPKVTSSILVKVEDINDNSIYDIAYLPSKYKVPISYITHDVSDSKIIFNNNGNFKDNNYPSNLYDGGFAIMNNKGILKGSFNEFDIDDFENTKEMHLIEPQDTTFDLITECSFAEKEPEIGVTVKQRTHSKTNDDFVTVKYFVKNISGKKLDSISVGVFADFDIGTTPSQNRGYTTDYWLYQRNSNGTETDFYGITVAENSKLNGINVTNTYDPNNVRESFYNNFSVLDTMSVKSDFKDYRSFISVGPYDFEINEEKEFTFGLVYGSSFDGFEQNVAKALSKSSFEVVTDIDEVRDVPNTFTLYQNYPNPFNPTTTINYYIPKNGLVTLKIYDILGREVAELVNKVQQNGNYKINFDGSNLTSGIYYYRLQAGKYIETKKMILLK